ncbi:hypothetical protein VitviT2T_018352 [Vitis vinifera]|uniref:Uncharacterized protein n=1 Tax=Vitis vinifera TaxID=29760 RepID=A0ABY9CXR8_VITVI|nr:hypothetical protein VitviT2T_018352 [Vitis vinifera]
MLLKYVGQEEIVPSQTTVKDPGAYDELGRSMLLKSATENVKLSTDLSNLEHEIDGSLFIGECNRESEDDSVSFGLIVMAVNSSSEHDTVAFIFNEGRVKELILRSFEEAKK